MPEQAVAGSILSVSTQYRASSGMFTGVDFVWYRIAAVVNLSFCNHDIILCMDYYRCVNYYHYIYTATSQMYPYMSPFLLEMPMYVYAISSIIITYYWRKSIEKFYTKN